jgi:starch synthase
MMDAPLRVLFVNSGILGHRSVARLLRGAAAADSGIEATHVDLSEDLTTGERVVRRLLTVGPMAGASFPGAALTLPRFRAEMNAGLLAAKRIAALEKAGKRFDAIHFHTQATAYASLRRMRRTPSIVSIDATQRLASREVPGWARLDYAPNAARDRRVFRAARAITATSRWAADDLAADLPGCAERVRVMPYPVPLDGFGEGWIGERFGRFTAEPSSPVRFLFVGGDFPRKGGPALLEAWRAGGFAGEATLTLVTDWPVGHVPPGVEVRCGIAAYSAEWFAAWRAADVFVMPTRGEAFGMVFQEAAAAGVPSIGTRIAAVPEIVDDGRTGILVPPGDPDALARAMRGLLESPELRREMGTAARRRIARVASPETYSANLMALIRSVARG